MFEEVKALLAKQLKLKDDSIIKPDSKIKADLGWYPETPFEVGIVKTIDWYLENEAWMDQVTSGAYQHYYDEMYKNR